jgi:RecA/RadA recombinase
MRIKNVGRSTIIFNGGSLEAGKVAVFNGEAEKIGSALLKAYPNKLMDLDNVKQEDIVDVVVEEKAVEVKASKAAPKNKSKKK